MNRHQRRIAASKMRATRDPLALADEYLDAGRLPEAENLFMEGLRASPNNPAILHSLGVLKSRLGKTGEAAELLRRAAELDPANPTVFSNLGKVLLTLGLLDEAQAACMEALRLNPEYSAGYRNLGSVLWEKDLLDDALEAFHAAIRFSETPPDVPLLKAIATILQRLGKKDEATLTYKMALMVEPDNADVHFELGNLIYSTGKWVEAIECYREAVRANPKHIRAAAEISLRSRVICDWRTLHQDDQVVRNLLDLFPEVETVHPFAMLAIPVSPSQRLANSRCWSNRYVVPATERFPDRNGRDAQSDGPVRIGYISGDYRNHATSHLIAEVIEKHDRSKFEVIGYSTGNDDGSGIRKRLVRAFDSFIDLEYIGDYEAAKKIYSDRIDILVDLKGYTHGARTKILGWRPAPIQVNYLGFPGSMGAEFVDYIISDLTITPPEYLSNYSEKVAHLPHSYQPNDTKKVISPNVPSRADCGLPATGTVFCCFNDSYKLTPTFFDVWMRLLASVPGSVLWLIDSNEFAKANLRQEAQRLGIDPNRLVFAPKIAVADHLARHQLADIFLDTLPVNAHTTASDALWAGLPIVTCLGDEFQGRVAASLLKAMGLSEFIASSLDEYEQIALTLAQDPERLADVKARVLANRLTSPLFDIERYTRDLESVYMQLVRRA